MLLKRAIFRKMTYVCTALTVLTLTGSNAGADTGRGWLPEKSGRMPDISHSQSFMTKYIWRGWNLGDEPVWQTDTSVSKWGVTLDVWTDYSLNNDKSRDGGRYQEFTEIDYTVDYTFNVGEMPEMIDFDGPDILDPLSLSAGYIYYTFPNADWEDKFFDTHEIYFGTSYGCFLQPSFTWYWDVDSGKGSPDGGGDGSYFLFGVSHTFAFGENGISATVGMTTGIIDEQWTDKTGWADMVFSGEACIPLLEYFTMKPNLAYSLILDSNTYNDAAENEFYGGVTVSFEY